MSDEKGIVDPVEVFDLFTSPEYVKNNGKIVGKSKGETIYTLKAILPTKKIGNLVLETVYKSTKKETTPCVFLSKRQWILLRIYGINFFIRKKKKQTPEETYIGFPDRMSFEKMVS